jgi:hypothetical protein
MSDSGRAEIKQLVVGSIFFRNKNNRIWLNLSGSASEIGALRDLSVDVSVQMAMAAHPASYGIHAAVRLLSFISISI